MHCNALQCGASQDDFLGTYAPETPDHPDKGELDVNFVNQFCTMNYIFLEDANFPQKYQFYYFQSNLGVINQGMDIFGSRGQQKNAKNKNN